MARWVQLQLSQGDVQGKHLINPETLKAMHVVQMAVPSQSVEGMFGFGYGLGWFTGLYQGHYVVAHNGGIDGFISEVLLFPKEKIGVVVLTNSDSHFLFPHTAALEIVNLLVGKESDEWLSKLADKEKQIKELIEKAGDKQELVCQSSPFRIIYSLKHKCYDHFISYAKLREAQKFGCSFTCNSSREINELDLAIEPSLSPIVFKKKASNDLLNSDYLKKFAGTFECPVFSIEIALKKGHLTATVLGQPSCEMKPEKPNLFSLKELPNCSFQFISESDGKVSELQLHQAGQTFKLKAKTATE